MKIDLNQEDNDDKLTSQPGGALTRRSFLVAVGAASIVSPSLQAESLSATGPVEAGNSPPTEVEMSAEDAIKAAKIRRALLSGPTQITKDATVVDTDENGQMVVLRKGTNKWICMPGNENKIGDVPMCADPIAMQWFADAKARKPKPTNAVPGICYMLCGALQHSNTDPFDKSGPPIPIGPHWMILWPFDAAECGLPTTVRDKGAWMMFAGTPWAYLHICGTPWDGNEYQGNDSAVWTLMYSKP